MKRKGDTDGKPHSGGRCEMCEAKVLLEIEDGIQLVELPSWEKDGTVTPRRRIVRGDQTLLFGPLLLPPTTERELRMFAAGYAEAAFRATHSREV